MYYSVILLFIMVQLVVVWGLLYYIACLYYIVIKMPVVVLLSCLDAWCVVYGRVTGLDFNFVCTCWRKKKYMICVQRT
jgi:hypothetical protein